MELAGRAYRFGFYVYEKEAKITVFSNHINQEKIEKETKLMDKIETVFSMGAAFVFGLLLTVLLLFALYCSTLISPEIFTKQIVQALFILCGTVGIGFISVLISVFLTEKVFPRIFSYAKCLFFRGLREYHATEHKVIALLGSGFSPTLENLRGASSFSWGCGMIKGFPRFFWFLEWLALSEPSEEKLIEGIRAIEMYYQKSKEKSLKGGNV